MAGDYGAACNGHSSRKPHCLPTSLVLRQSSCNRYVCAEVPNEFWLQLSSLRCLEIIHVFGLEQRSFVDALRDISTASRLADRTLTMTDGRRAQPSVFPALCAVGFIRFHWDIRATAGEAGVSIRDATRTFLEGLALGLFAWGGKLRELKFASCKGIIPSIESLTRLSSRADCIVWEKRVYCRVPESGNPQIVWNPY